MMIKRNKSLNTGNCSRRDKPFHILITILKPPYGRSEYQYICGQGRIQVSSTSLSGRCFIYI